MTAADAHNTPEERIAKLECKQAWTSRSGMSLSDMIGGQVLAWLGGLATLLGILLFLVLAVSTDGSGRRRASCWPRRHARH